MRWTLQDEQRAGYVYPVNKPHHGPTGRFGAKAWPAHVPEPGPDENTKEDFATREDAMLWVETWAVHL